MLFNLGLESVGLLVLRLAMAMVFLPSGLNKLKGLKASSKGLMLPLWFVTLMALGEFLGGITMILGFLTEIAAIGFALILVGAIYFKVSKWKTSFSGSHGWNMDLILLIIAIALYSLGSGAISLDAVLGIYP